jgi:hypothetical protein
MRCMLQDSINELRSQRTSHGSLQLFGDPTSIFTSDPPTNDGYSAAFTQ